MSICPRFIYHYYHPPPPKHTNSTVSDILSAAKIQVNPTVVPIVGFEPGRPLYGQMIL